MERLAEIAELVKQGADPETFKVELDALLGTEMSGRDPVADATWEAEYEEQRGGGYCE